MSQSQLTYHNHMIRASLHRIYDSLRAVFYPKITPLVVELVTLLEQSPDSFEVGVEEHEPFAAFVQPVGRVSNIEAGIDSFLSQVRIRLEPNRVSLDTADHIGLPLSSADLQVICNAVRRWNAIQSLNLENRRAQLVRDNPL